MNTIRNATLLVAASAITATTQAGDYIVYGAGTASCGEWTMERERGRHQDIDYWMLGYLSAAGNYSAGLRKTDRYAVRAFVDNYCKQNPLKQVVDAAESLVLALKQRPK